MNEFQLPPALSGERQDIETPAGRIGVYRAGPDQPAANKTPMLFVHSMNAAGSAYEMRPLYEHYKNERTVYALDMPGFGFSERSDREYSARLMTSAIVAIAEKIREGHDGERIDALALSLSSEFLARAASENPDLFRSAALVSGTGFDKRGPYRDAPGTTRAMPWLYYFFRFPLWTRGFYKLLTTRRVIRYFLEKTWGSKYINEALLDYDYLTTQQPGARFAPYYFVSGYLFSRDITRVYETLKLPVWLSHGVRGDFQDFKNAREFESAPNWTITEFQTGALPYFELPDDFIRRYDEFLARA